MLLGFPESGHVSGYYPDSPNIMKAEIEALSKFADSKGLLPENTRLHKTPDGNFELLIASAEKQPKQNDRDIPEDLYNLDGDLQGKTLKLVWGDHATEMSNVSKQMMAAQQSALNSVEKDMCGAYERSFRSGELL